MNVFILTLISDLGERVGNGNDNGMAQESSKWADLKAGVRESRRQFASLAVRVPTNFSFRKCVVGPNNVPATRIYFLATAQVHVISSLRALKYRGSQNKKYTVTALPNAICIL